MKKLATILIICLLLTGQLFADSTNDTNTQTNTSGSNTNITGGYESTTTTTYEDGATNTTTSNSTGSDIPVNTANSPSYSAMSQDVCSMGVSGSISTLGLGVSAGKHVRDLNCERIKLSKVLYDYGMMVAAVSIQCQDERVFEAMLMAGTPCPFEGKIGKEAITEWKKYDIERPDYDTYIEKLEKRSQIDEELAAIALEEQRKEAEQKAAEDAAKRKAEEEASKEATSEEINNKSQSIIPSPVEEVIEFNPQGK